MTTIDQNPEQLNALAQEVIRVSGLDVTCTRDCEVLSEELRAFDGRFAVSISTLRRFFGLIPKHGKYSTNTLNTLSRYVGHASYRAWRQSTHPPLNHLPADIPEPSAQRVRNKSPQGWSTQEAQAQLERFVERFGDPKNFHLTTREFRRLKDAVFTIYQRGTLDMGLWMDVAAHPHLLRFVMEQFPPLDFLATFGQTMLESYTEQATSAGEVLFAQSLKAAGLVAQDAPWAHTLLALPKVEPLNPLIHPLVQSRQIGIALLAESEGHGLNTRGQSAVDLALEGLRNEHTLWPRWANQSCYFAFNLADWAIMSGEQSVVQAISENIQQFKNSQDWYNRDSDMDTILNLRQVWNWIELGEKENASSVLEQLDWMAFESMETRTLSLWYHSALWVLNHVPSQICEANIKQAAAVTHYHGLKRRILDIVARHSS